MANFRKAEGRSKVYVVEGVRAHTLRSFLDVPDSPTRMCRVSSQMAVISITLSLQSMASRYRERLAPIWQVPQLGAYSRSLLKSAASQKSCGC